MVHAPHHHAPAHNGPGKAFFDGFAAVVRVVALVALVALVGLVLAEIMSRSLFNRSLDIIEEFAGYLVVAITFLGAALALRDGTLFQVEFVYDRFPAGFRRALGMVYLLISFVVTCVLVWQTAKLVISSFDRGKVAATVLMTPIWIPQLVMPVGLAAIAVFLLERGLAELSLRRTV